MSVIVLLVGILAGSSALMGGDPFTTKEQKPANHLTEILFAVKASNPGGAMIPVSDFLEIISPAMLHDGTELRPGEALREGDLIRGGVMVNKGEDTYLLFVKRGEGVSVLTMEPQAALVAEEPYAFPIGHDLYCKCRCSHAGPGPWVYLPMRSAGTCPPAVTSCEANGYRGTLESCSQVWADPNDN